MTEIVKTPDLLSALSLPEQQALEYFEKKSAVTATRGRGDPDSYSLAPDVQARMFNLFLQGRTLQDIRAVNPQFGLGQIVHAAVVGRWFGRRDEYLDELLVSVRNRAVQSVAEAVNFVADQMAATHALHADQVAKFLQTRDVGDLGGFAATSVKQYKELVELLIRLTGQDKVSTVNHNVRPAPAAPPPLAGPRDPAANLKRWAGKT